MSQAIPQEKIDKIMRTKGETRGFNIKHDGEYILRTEGAMGLKKLEAELERLGYPIKYQEIVNMSFLPAGLRALSLLAIEKTFGYDNEGIRNVGAYHPKTSLIVNLFAKYIYSVPKVMKKAQEMWSKYWTVGQFKFIEFNDKENYAIVLIENFDLDAIFCRCEEGYFASLAQIVLGEKNVTCKETKCTFEGDKNHKFIIKWQ